MVNKCDAPTGRCEEDSMCVNGDGPPVQRLIHHQRRGGIMTPPMTDAELLAYIERTPELAALFPDAARWLSPHAAPYANVARAFHAHEQRVREEQHRVTVKRCADVCEQRADSLRDGSAIARQCAKDVLSQMDVLAKQGGK